MNASSPRKARASLPVRVALIIIAVALAAVAALAVVNLVAANQYNQATQSLIENIKTSQSQTPDLDKLNAQQQQTDAQFRPGRCCCRSCVRRSSITVRYPSN